MLRRLVWVALTALLIAVVPTAARAAGGSGYITPSATVQLKAYGCFYVPYSATITATTGTVDWDLDLRVLYPNGSVLDSGFDYGSGVGTFTDTEEMFFCSPARATTVQVRPEWPTPANATT